MPGQRHFCRGRPAGRSTGLHQAQRRPGLCRWLEEHHQAQGRVARGRRVEWQAGQGRSADPLTLAGACRDRDRCRRHWRRPGGPVPGFPTGAAGHRRAPDRGLAAGGGARGGAGLLEVFEGGVGGMGAHLMDALPQAGGQCVTLYGDKPIYDIAGIPVCTGRELIDRLLAQLAPFKPHWHLNTLVAALAPQPDARLLLETDTGARLLARSVFIAAGVSAFVPRTLKMAGMERFVGTQFFYQVLPAGMDVTGRQVIVHGGDEGAVACAVELAEQGRAARVSLLYRRDLFQAPEALLQRLQQLRAAGRIAVEVGQITGCASSGMPQCSTLRALQVVDAQGASHALPVDVLVAVLGISPRLGTLTDWGMAMARKQLQVDTEAFRTSVPGIYAVGEITNYPGKRRLILCGFNEATLADFAAAEALKGDKVALQYTATSAHLHRLLGVAPASGATGS